MARWRSCVVPPLRTRRANRPAGSVDRHWISPSRIAATECPSAGCKPADVGWGHSSRGSSGPSASRPAFLTDDAYRSAQNQRRPVLPDWQSAPESARYRARMKGIPLPLHQYRWLRGHHRESSAMAREQVSRLMSRARNLSHLRATSDCRSVGQALAGPRAPGRAPGCIYC